MNDTTERADRARLSPHLRRLESESIGIIREVAAEFRNPVMLYSIGKDSGVMLHVALKAFYPSKPPFPLLHVDTTWKFRDMIRFRDQIAARHGVELLVYTNPEGLARGINPITSGSQLHTQVMKTEALKQALDKWQFDAAFGATRRKAAPRSASSRSAPRDTRGTRAISARSSGTSITPGSARVRRCASSRSRTGPSSTSGSTRALRTSRWCRCTSPRRAR
jgi:sulfate adenylyltransferase subunit 2